MIEGQQVDEEIQEVRDDMLALVRFGETREFKDELPSVTRLRQRSRNPGYHSPSWTQQGFLAFNDRVYLPDGEHSRLKIMVARHSAPLAGHPGIAKTRELVERDYIWSGVSKDIEEFVSGCTVCQTAKATHHKPYGLLKTLEVPSRPWEHISMDFIEPLPESNGFDSVLVVIDRHSKWATFIPTHTTIDSSELATILIDRVFALHGFPKSIVSDRGSKFISRFWRYLNGRLNVELRLSTAFHPQTDGQTERTNQSLEAYLRIYCAYNQDDWSTLLPQAAFAYNNSVHSAIKTTPFFMNHGFHPRWTEEITTTTAIEVPAASKVVIDLDAMHSECSEYIAKANEQYEDQANRDRMEAPLFEVGDSVLLNMKNVKTKRPSRKLDIKHGGPYVIEAKVGSHAYRLRLPKGVRLHPVFHVSMLEPFHPPTIDGQAVPKPTPIEVDGELEWEVSKILDSRYFGRYRKLQYLVEWAGCEGTPDAQSWEPANNTANARELYAEFHRLHPGKPGAPADHA